jgi:transposase
MWCIPGELDREYIERMEDILDLLAKPENPGEPVICLDERPVQLHADVRKPRPARPGRIARRDSEYERRGTANIFAVTNLKSGMHMTHGTRDRTGPKFAQLLKRIAEMYPFARKIHLIMDNFNTHCLKSLTDYFGEVEGSRLWNRFQPHFTPKHGSWLNPAEIEISLVSRECLGHDRIPDFMQLAHRVSIWNKEANRMRRKINWTFSSAKAREKFRYRRSGVRITLARH